MAGTVNNAREAAYLAVLTIVGGLLLACGFWVTGAGAMFDVPTAPRTVPASTEQPATGVARTGPAAPTAPEDDVTDVVDAPEAGDVEGGPDGRPAGTGS